MLTDETLSNSQPRKSVTGGFNKSNIPRMSSASLMNLDTMSSTKGFNALNNLFLPCINCNNLVHVDEIENHSNVCVRVKEEVIVAETSNFTCHTIDFKLRKLQEHINYLKNSELNNTPEIQKEMHYISLLSQYIIDAANISKIDNKSIAELKKISLNTDVT